MDITDFYAFPSPERAGHLVLVANTLPMAAPDARFSDGLVYRFRLRSLDAAPDHGSELFIVDSHELVFDCVFSAPTPDADGRPPAQQGECRTPSGEVLAFGVDDEQATGAHGVRVFAGPRWDPFILDAPAALKTISTGRLSFTEPGSIFLDGKNVLGLVIEIDCARILGDVSLVAVVAETLTRGTVQVRLERVGRPEVKNMLLAPKQFDRVNQDLEIRDLYNAEDVFHMNGDYRGAYRARLDANLAFWDSLDGAVDWPVDDHGAHPLTDLFLADYLVVDTTKPYSEQGSFLEIEMAARERRPHLSCGGRALNDDVMDTFFTLLVNAGKGPTIRDGVDQATMPAGHTFPYLVPPNPDPPKPPDPHETIEAVKS